VAEFRLALKLRPDFVEAHNNLGNALGALGRFDEAISSYDRALALKPDYAQGCSNLGKALLSQGKLEDARASIERALSLSPGHAGTYSTLGAVLRAMGKLEEARACLEQAIALDPRNAEAYNNLSNVLQEQNDPTGAKACLMRAIQLKPDYAVAYHNLGTALREEGNLCDARACFDKALALKPDSAEVLYSIARLLRDQGDLEEAKNCLLRTLQLKPDHAEARGDLGKLLFDQGDLEAARAQLEQTLAVKPACVEALTTLGALLNDRGDAEGATTALERAIALRPDFALAQWNLALVQLREGNYSAGWCNFEGRCRIREITPRTFPQPLWRGEPLKGAAILLQAEQGLGDSLQFLRYIPMVKAAGGFVILSIQERLRRLAGQIPEVDVLAISGDPLPRFDLYCPLMSLPLAFATTVASIPARVPYLAAPAEAQQKAAELPWPAEGLRVGLVWAGAPGHTRDRFRSMDLADLASLFDIPGVTFFSVQLGQAAEQQGSVRVPIIDLAPTIVDMADTAALLAHLDLLISVDTSVVHLAGALARPAWLLLPFSPDWRWLRNREDTPWYPTVRLFRQPSAGDWRSVVARVAVELARVAADFHV
jgi:Flp pilus assembly protein TadD